MSLATNHEDPLIGAAGFIFQTPVRAKRSKVKKLPSGGVVAKLLRRMAVRKITAVTSKRAEVMVKVTGAARGRRHLGEHLAYITRNGKLVAERSDGELIIGSRDVRELADEWWAMRGDGRPTSARDTINLVLSMPSGADRDAVAAAASSFARTEFGGRFDYVIAHHTDTGHPHAHLTIRTVNERGQCLDPRKADLQAWREAFAEALRARGVAAEATPRRSRGVVRKATRGVIAQIEKDRKDRKKNRPAARVHVSKVKEAVEEVSKGVARVPEPWEVKTRKRQEEIRGAWLTVAEELGRSTDPEEKGLAEKVRGFIAGMAPVLTERELLAQEVRKSLDRQPASAPQQQHDRRR